LDSVRNWASSDAPSTTSLATIGAPARDLSRVLRNFSSESGPARCFASAIRASIDLRASGARRGREHDGARLGGARCAAL
jgi:hypothetical protein